MFRKKEKVAEKVENAEVNEEEINPESRTDEDRDLHNVFGKARQEETRLTEASGQIIRRLRDLDNERLKVIEEIERLGLEAEKESEEMEKELSTLREQVASLTKVLEEMHRKRRI